MSIATCAVEKDNPIKEKLSLPKPFSITISLEHFVLAFLIGVVAILAYWNITMITLLNDTVLLNNLHRFEMDKYQQLIKQEEFRIKMYQDELEVLYKQVKFAEAQGYLTTP